MSGSLGTGALAVGTGFALAILIASAFTAGALVARLDPDARGAIRASTLYIAGFGALVLAHLIPGALGVLSREAVLISAILIAAAAGLLPRVPRARDEEREEATRTTSSLLSSAIAAGAAIAFGGWALAAAGGQILNPISGTDVATFDLPMISRWIESGSFWSFNEFAPLVSHGSYPHNADVGMLSLVLPWGSDFAARAAAYVALPAAAVAIVALARELGAPLTSAIACACAALATPIVTFPLFQLAMPDAFILPTFIGGCALLARHCRTGERGAPILAGLGLGLAFGSKWYGVTIVAAVLLAWLGLRGLGRGAVPWRRLGRDLSIVLALIALAGGFWLVRNAVEYDNPLFPVSFEPLGLTILDAPFDPVREQAGESIANALSDPGRLGELLSGPLADAFDLGGAIFLLAALVALGLGIRALRGDAADGRARALAGAGAAGLLIALAYVLTPYTAGPEESDRLAFVNSRYGVPAVLVGAACAAAIAAGGPRRRLAIEAGAGIVLTAALVGNPLALSGGRIAAGIAAAAALAALVLALARRPRPIAGAPAVRAIAAATAAVAVFAAVVIVEDRYSANRLEQDPVFTWVIENAPENSRIGVAGAWTRTGPPPFLAMLGPTFENEVAFIAREEDRLLREIGTREEWEAAVDSLDLDLLVVGTLPTQTGDPRRWAEELGAPLAAAGPRFVLYDLR